jgi:hypothetical protein
VGNRHRLMAYTAVSVLCGLAVPGCSMSQPAATEAILRDETSCLRLAGSEVSGTKIDSAIYVKTGDTVLDKPPFTLKSPANVCRVTVTLSSGPGSSIKAEYWLPDTWNNKFYAVGGGGFSGGLDSAPLMILDPVAKGYAGASSDAGHTTVEGAQWAHNEPAKLADWAYRANHHTAVFGKNLIAGYYGEAPRRAYFEGCSNGGRDALTLVQKHPEDFDAIISGAPAADWTGLMTSFVLNRKTMEAFGASGQQAKFKMVNDAIMAKCDTLDGVKDGVLEQPNACNFDPSEVQCKADETSNCISKAEADALRTIYQGHSLASGRKVFAGFPLGAEADPGGWRDSSKGGTSQMGIDYFRWMVYGDASWNPDQFDVERNYAQAVERTGSIIDSTNPDITPFTGRGGKLMLWHGWNDQLIAAEGTIEYYNAVKSKLGAAADQSVRLFMAPGVNHCFGGAGPSSFDKLGELDRWVETNKPPERIIATKYENDLFRFIGMPTKPARTRPLCAWPQVARYNGSGSTDDEANFTCALLPASP